MSYCFTATLHNTNFDETITKVTEELQKVGFGILTEIDVQATFKKKLDVDFRKYRILGACSPGFAHKALQAEINIGSMLPCNVVVMENDDGSIGVSIVDPLASFMAVQNEAITPIALEVRDKLAAVVDRLK